MIRALIVILILTLANGCKTDEFPYEVDNLTLPANSHSIFVIGDWGRRGNDKMLSNAHIMNEIACENVINSVLTVGDNFYDNGVSSTSDSHWEKSFEDVFSGSCLKPIPWFPALGNHDIRGSAQAQYDYSNHSHRWNFPGQYYDRWITTEDSLLIHFVTVDTDPFKTSYYERPNNDAVEFHLANSDTVAQLAWLDSVLGVGDPDWLIVYGHHAVFGAEGRHGSTPELIHAFAPKFEEHGVDVYFNGHNHSLEVSEVDDVVYAASGSFSSSQSRIELQPFSQFGTIDSGFLVATFSETEMLLSFMDSRGSLIHEFSKSK